MKKSNKNENESGLLFLIGLMIGFGIGFIANSFFGGLFLGLGFGFLGSWYSNKR